MKEFKVGTKGGADGEQPSLVCGVLSEVVRKVMVGALLVLLLETYLCCDDVDNGVSEDLVIWGETTLHEYCLC